MSFHNRTRYETTIPAPGVQMGIPVAVNPAILASNANLARVINAASKQGGEGKSADDPSTTSSAHDRMAWRTFLMEAVLGGTETMRAAGKVLMPMYTGEKQGDWQTRLGQAVLFNYTERTASDLSGRLFKTPPKVPSLEEGLPADLVLHVDDVDGEGTAIIRFMQHWFKRGLELGLMPVIVDTPRNATAADRKTPTWSIIHPDNILFAHQKQLEDGTIIVDHLRVLECSTEMDGFREVEVRRIRVYEVGRIRVYKEDKEKLKGRESPWVLEDEWGTDWDRVPLVVFYSNRIGFMEAVPPLQDLAYLNTRHWQSYSDQASILTIARFPILVATGTSSGTKGAQTLSPRKMFRIPDANGKLQYVEHTGQAINAGKDDLEMLEHMMSNYGSEFLKSRPGSTAATSRALDSAESTSLLHSIANDFEDSVHELLVMTTRAFKSFDATAKVPRIEFTVDLSISQSDSTELSTLDLARRRHDISRKAYLNELARRDILADTFNPDNDFKQMKEELVVERELGLLKQENQDAIPNAENSLSRAASGKSSRGKPDNGRASTGEEDEEKDEQIQGSNLTPGTVFYASLGYK